MVRKTVVVAGTALITALTGCAASIEDRAADDLQEWLDGAHEGHLHRRALDPTSTGAAALQALDPYGYALRSSAEGDVITLVRTIATEIEEGGGWSYTQYSVGACIEIRIEAGTGGSDRGHVQTEPVECPPGVVVEFEGGPVDEVITDLDGRSDDVEEPPYDPPVCISGQPCTEGGG
ncbi:hypothetical protein [Blastococcus sp. SYSU DS0619]